VLVAVLAGTGLYLTLDKRVTLVVDGRAERVGTLSLSVGQLLERRGIALGPRDSVAPGPETGLTEGLVVQVRHAKAVTLILSGRSRTLWSTGLTVGDVLRETGLHAYAPAAEPPVATPLAGDDVITISPSRQVALVVGGRSRQVVTGALTVRDLLTEHRVRLDRDDRVRPRLDVSLVPGMVVRVVRVTERRATVIEHEEGDTVYRYDEGLPRDQVRVERAGSAGIARRTYVERYVDGLLVSRVPVSVEIVRQAVPRIVVIGTKEVGYQVGLASWYERTGLVAAHRWLPFGTRVTVTNVETGASVTVVINDRGPYIGGRVIDLGDDAFARIAPLGSGVCQVRISW
jgi:uncharacterized protein YabE (DUF348 family)